MTEPQNSNETIMYRLGVLEMSVGTLSEKLDALTKPLIELCAQQPQSKIAEFEKRIAELERTGAYNRGVGKGLMLAVGAIGGLVGASASFVIERLFK